MSFDKLNAFQRSLVSAIAGLLAYGAWGVYANSAHGSAAAIKAGCVQGGYSFILTFVITIGMEALYISLKKHMSLKKRELGLATSAHDSHLIDSQTSTRLFALTASITCMILYLSSWLVNYLAGTPEIFMTVLPGYIIGTIYSLGYIAKLVRADSRR